MRGLSIALLLMLFGALSYGEDAPTAAPPADDPVQVWSRPEPVDSAPPYASPYFRRHRRPPPPLDPAPPDPKDSMFEVGATLGTPSILNLNLGYWGPQDFPIVTRVSGMDYGPTRGIQVDVGYAFHRDAELRQYVALTAISMTVGSSYFNWYSSNPTSSQYTFTGGGVLYGMNWYGLSFQLGLAMGQGNSVENNPAFNPGGTSTIDQFQPLLLFQVGYTFLW